MTAARPNSAAKPGMGKYEGEACICLLFHSFSSPLLSRANKLPVYFIQLLSAQTTAQQLCSTKTVQSMV